MKNECTEAGTPLREKNTQSSYTSRRVLGTILGYIYKRTIISKLKRRIYNEHVCTQEPFLDRYVRFISARERRVLVIPRTPPLLYSVHIGR